MKYIKYLGVLIIAVVLAGVAWAAFTDKGKVLGSSFSVGSSDLKFLTNLSGGIASENLSDELPGPNFANISPNWQENYVMKIYNNGTTNLEITSNSNYSTANDPDDLRSYIFVEPFVWNDTNENGVLDNQEFGNSFGKKTIIKWKTEGFDLGPIVPGETNGYVLQFSADALSDTKQGKSAVYDFEFDAIQI